MSLIFEGAELNFSCVTEPDEETFRKLMSTPIVGVEEPIDTEETEEEKKKKAEREAARQRKAQQNKDQRDKKRKGKEIAGEEEEAQGDESTDEDQTIAEGREIITRSKSQKTPPKKKKARRRNPQRGIVIQDRNQEGGEEEEEEEEEPLKKKKKRRISREEEDRSEDMDLEIFRDIDRVVDEETEERNEEAHADEPSIDTPRLEDLFVLPPAEEMVESTSQGKTSRYEEEPEPKILEEYEKDTFKVYLPYASMIREVEKKPEREAGVFNRALLKMITPAHMKKSMERPERSLRKAADILTDCARIVNKAGEDWEKKEAELQEELDTLRVDRFEVQKNLDSSEAEVRRLRLRMIERDNEIITQADLLTKLGNEVDKHRKNEEEYQRYQNELLAQIEEHADEKKTLEDKIEFLEEEMRNSKKRTEEAIQLLKEDYEKILAEKEKEKMAEIEKVKREILVKYHHSKAFLLAAWIKLRNPLRSVIYKLLLQIGNVFPMTPEMFGIYNPPSIMPENMSKYSWDQEKDILVDEKGEPLPWKMDIKSGQPKPILWRWPLSMWPKELAHPNRKPSTAGSSQAGPSGGTSGSKGGEREEEKKEKEKEKKVDEIKGDAGKSTIGEDQEKEKSEMEKKKEEEKGKKVENKETSKKKSVEEEKEKEKRKEGEKKKGEKKQPGGKKDDEKKKQVEKKIDDEKEKQVEKK